MSRKPVVSVLFLMAALFAAAPLGAQSSTASITGRVVDPTDAPVAGAPLRVTNIDTGIVRESAKLSGDAHSRLNGWFNTGVFSNPAAFTYGTTGRTLPDVRDHGTNNFDGGFFKNNRFGEDGRFNVQFRAELFNMFNRVRFLDPGLTYGTAQFGIVSAQANSSRQIQFALKLIY